MLKENLLVVGSGIQAVGQWTVETLTSIRSAEHIIYGVYDPVMEITVQSLAQEIGVPCTSLGQFYGEHKDRLETYREMVQCIMESVRSNKRTVCVLYGHPGVFAMPSHAAIAQARSEGFHARMIPGVSAADCLFADLGVDPGEYGCVEYEATAFLKRQLPTLPMCHCILWQIGGLCINTGPRKKGYSLPALPLLQEKLLRTYSPEHPVTVYEANTFSLLPFEAAPTVYTPIPLGQLSTAPLSFASTLYIPPSVTIQMDTEIVERLAMLG